MAKGVYVRSRDIVQMMLTSKVSIIENSNRVQAKVIQNAI